VPEVRRLLRALADPCDRREGRLHWSRWRRGRQASARRCHHARRARRPSSSLPTTLAAIVVPGTPALTEAGWVQIRSLLPPRGRRGKQWCDHRDMVGGMLWVMRTGAAWRELPPEYGAWQTCHSRYARWKGDGTWSRILAALRSPPGQPEPDAQPGRSEPNAAG
jgi:transposase